LPAPAQAALRNRAVRAVLDGMTQAEAARVFGVHHNAVNRWVKRYRQGGWDGLSERRRGRRPGEQAALAEPQQQEVIALVRDATPDQLGLAGFLWTREAVAELIARHSGRWLARTTVGAYLRGWGFSPQKPQRRALEQNPAAVRRGDTLVVWKLDRLGRSLRHLVDTVSGLAERGVGFRSLQEAIDTTTPGGKLVFHVFAALAEFERDLIRERTAGWAGCRPGPGPPRRPTIGADGTQARGRAGMYGSGQYSVAAIAATLGVSRASIYRHD
jgi:transposase